MLIAVMTSQIGTEALSVKVGSHRRPTGSPYLNSQSQSVIFSSIPDRFLLFMLYFSRQVLCVLSNTIKRPPFTTFKLKGIIAISTAFIIFTACRFPSCCRHKLIKPTAQHNVKTVTRLIRDWSLITGRGGLQNGKIAGPKLFAPPPSRQGKTFCAPPFKEWKLNAPPLQYG